MSTVTPAALRALAGRLKRFRRSTPFALLADHLQNNPGLLSRSVEVYLRDVTANVNALLDYVEKLEAERNNLYALCASRMDRSELEAAVGGKRS